MRGPYTRRKADAVWKALDSAGQALESFEGTRPILCYAVWDVNLENRAYVPNRKRPRKRLV